MVRPQFWPFALKASGGAPISRSISRLFGLVDASLPALLMPTARSAIRPIPHPGLFCRALRGGKRTIGDPLQKAMERSLARIRLCEPCHFRACRVAPRFGPIAPIPGRPIGGKFCRVQRFKLRMSGKQRSPGLREIAQNPLPAALPSPQRDRSTKNPRTGAGRPTFWRARIAPVDQFCCSSSAAAAATPAS